jgi:hypothetical protein
MHTIFFIFVDKKRYTMEKQLPDMIYSTPHQVSYSTPHLFLIKQTIWSRWLKGINTQAIHVKQSWEKRLHNIGLTWHTPSYTLYTCYLCKHYFPPIIYLIKHWRILYSDKKLFFLGEHRMAKFRHFSLEAVVESSNPIWSVYNFIVVLLV